MCYSTPKPSGDEIQRVGERVDDLAQMAVDDINPLSCSLGGTAAITME